MVIVVVIVLVMVLVFVRVLVLPGLGGLTMGPLAMLRWDVLG